MAKLKSFSPDHLIEEAERSGLFQCPRCGLVWFGGPDIQVCPEGSHGKPVRVALLCRTCDVVVPIERIAAHLKGKIHRMGVEHSN